MTVAGPTMESSGSWSTVVVLSKKCCIASTCVPVWEPIESTDTLELSPLLTRDVGSMRISGLPGYTAPPVRSGIEMSMIFGTRDCGARILRRQADRPGFNNPGFWNNDRATVSLDDAQDHSRRGADVHRRVHWPRDQWRRAVD